ncbi:MAG: cytidylate kinase-like family protein [Butyrivibrio sp.]|nr:cytidylate kinase-like family protein [Butyrivibrio sp.]
MKTFVITIARGLGSGGSHVAHKLAKELGIPCYDDEILDMASEKSGINEEYFYQANERIKKGQLAIAHSKGVYTGTTYAINDKRYLSNENLFNLQAQIIRGLALEEKTSCIIIGKAANRIIGSLKNVVTVNIQAPIDYCIRNIVNRRMVSEQEAEALIYETDRYRKDYYKYYMGGEWLNPKEYDLTINTASVGEDYAVNEIISLLKLRKLIEN